VYDCTAETSALRHAKTCSGELSERSSRPGLKENIVKLYKNYLNNTDVGRHMAWHNNVRLGCGHYRCDGFIFAVCHYGPG
ncbi:hypothetical protein TELCIR_20828, partial [Teladorsagia circumcincta]